MKIKKEEDNCNSLQKRLTANLNPTLVGQQWELINFFIPSRELKYSTSGQIDLKISVCGDWNWQYHHLNTANNILSLEGRAGRVSC
jgi:hypothetical protein